MVSSTVSSSSEEESRAFWDSQHSSIYVRLAPNADGRVYTVGRGKNDWFQGSLAGEIPYTPPIYYVATLTEFILIHRS